MPIAKRVPIVSSQLRVRSSRIKTLLAKSNSFGVRIKPSIVKVDVKSNSKVLNKFRNYTVTRLCFQRLCDQSQGTGSRIISFSRRFVNVSETSLSLVVPGLGKSNSGVTS
jgi:hypothetical protein